jgi:hypothetical protein
MYRCPTAEASAARIRKEGSGPSKLVLSRRYACFIGSGTALIVPPFQSSPNCLAAEQFHIASQFFHNIFASNYSLYLGQIELAVLLPSDQSNRRNQRNRSFIPRASWS